MTTKKRIVVIGNGMGGARFAEDLIANNGLDQFDVVMFGDEPYGNYNRILLSNVLAGSHEPKDIFMNPLSWYEDNNIRLHAGVRVDAIDRDRKIVRSADGIEEPYDHLVFATGSRPFIPPIQGLTGDTGTFRKGIYLFRTLDDSLEMMRFSEGARKAVVIGGGLLGLEAARGLMNLGLEVHVVELAPHPMAVQLDPPAGAVLKKTLEDNMGIRVHTGVSVTMALGHGQVEGVVLSNGTVELCDMLVISAGIRSNTALAAEAGLEVHRGIVVGDDLASVSDPSISAVGECAEHRGTTYGLVAPTWEQAAVLAARLSGTDPEAIYRGSNTSTKLKVMGIDLLTLGEKEPANEADEVVTFSNPAVGVYKKLIVRDGKLVGAILLGDPLGGPRLLEAFHRSAELPENRADLLFPAMLQDSPGSAVDDAPDSFQVCNCNGVSKGQILEALRGGCTSLRAVGEATRAGTGCGSCKPDIQKVLEAAFDGPIEEDPSVHYYVPAIPLRKPELVEAIQQQSLRSVSAVLEALADGPADAKSKIGLASLLKIIWGETYHDERDSRFINDRVHANIQKDGTFSVVPRILGGVVTPGELRTIADVAEKYEVGMVKITGGQRIDLLGVRKSSLPDIWRDLGMPSGHAYTKAVRTVKTCVGEEYCRFGLGDSTGLGIAIERKFRGMETPHKVKMAASACPRNCAESTTKDVGVVAIEGGRWEIYVGGAAGSTVRKGDILTVVDTHDEVLKYTGRFLQYYRENARYLERTYDFVPRIGIGELRRVLVEDQSGLADRLDRDIEKAAAEYRDPWKEGDQPLHPAQFSEEPVAPEVAVPR